MQEIRTSGSMSGDGKRSVAAWPKLPRPSSIEPDLQISPIRLSDQLHSVHALPLLPQKPT